MAVRNTRWASTVKFCREIVNWQVKHNQCVVHVAKGYAQMIANAVAFEHPMQNKYTVLPHQLKRWMKLLAFIFTGPCQPTEDNFRRIPLLVCQNKVGKALNGSSLIIEIMQILKFHKESWILSRRLPPVVINYWHSATNKIPEATSVHDVELEHGTEEGICPFTVHTLTSKEYDTTSIETLKAM